MEPSGSELRAEMTSLTGTGPTRLARRSNVSWR